VPPSILDPFRLASSRRLLSVSVPPTIMVPDPSIALINSLFFSCREAGVGFAPESAAQSVSPEVLVAEISHLAGLPLKALKAAWAAEFRREPPKGLRRDLLLRTLAWRLQEKAFGGHDRATLRLLEAYGQKKAGDTRCQRLKAVAPSWSGNSVAPVTPLPPAAEGEGGHGLGRPPPPVLTSPEGREGPPADSFRGPYILHCTIKRNSGRRRVWVILSLGTILPLTSVRPHSGSLEFLSKIKLMQATHVRERSHNVRGGRRFCWCYCWYRLT